MHDQLLTTAEPTGIVGESFRPPRGVLLVMALGGVGIIWGKLVQGTPFWVLTLGGVALTLAGQIRLSRLGRQWPRDVAAAGLTVATPPKAPIGMRPGFVRGLRIFLAMVAAVLLLDLLNG